MSTTASAGSPKPRSPTGLTGDGTNTFTWSDADRLTARGADTFGYDPLDRLTSSTVSGTSRSYAYNGDGLLQTRTQGAATSLLWDPATSPSRLLAQGGERIVYGLGPLYLIKADGTTRALARDGGKSVRAEIDGAGAVTGSWRYRAYGEIAQSSGQATPSVLAYAGQLLDPSGLYYMRARWYDAATGRFASRDPMSGEAASPSSLNAFGYAIGNPILRTDPSGASVIIDDAKGCVTLRCGDPSPAPDLKRKYVTSGAVQMRPQVFGDPGSEQRILVIADPGRPIMPILVLFANDKQAPPSYPDPREPTSYTGYPPGDVPGTLPPDWGPGRPTRDKTGTRWPGPNPGEQLRLMPGDPGAWETVHQGPYVEISIEGKEWRIPLEGNPALR
jgi:RHS repeat-associated protein